MPADVSSCRGSSPTAGRRCFFRAVRILLSLFVEAEADLHRHLGRKIRACLEVAPDICHLEPVEVAQGLLRPFQGMADSLIDAFARAADNFSDTVYVIVHSSSSPDDSRVRKAGRDGG